MTVQENNMWSGYVLIPTLGGAFREQFIETESRSVWNEAVERSAETAIAYLKERIVNKVRPVLVQQPDDGTVRVRVRQIGYYAKGHIANWNLGGTPKDMRAIEKRLRNAVRYWTVEFPKEQDRLTIELFAQYLKTLPAATADHEAWYDRPCRFCAACGDYDGESHEPEQWSVDLCDACRDAPAFRAAARDHLRAMLLEGLN